MPSWAFYGRFVFQTIISPEDFEASREYEFAEHKVVENISRLQWTGDNTEEMEMNGLFHYKFCTPNIEMGNLYALAETHRPYSLVYGNGQFRGFFVIKKLVATYSTFLQDGSLLATQFKILFKGVPLQQIYDALHPPQPGHQPWAVLNPNQGPVIVTQNPFTGGTSGAGGGSKGGGATLVLPVDTAAANAIFGSVPAPAVPGFLLPASATGISAVTRTLPPTGPPSAIFNPSSAPISGIVRTE